MGSQTAKCVHCGEHLKIILSQSDVQTTLGESENVQSNWIPAKPSSSGATLGLFVACGMLIFWLLLIVGGIHNMSEGKHTAEPTLRALLAGRINGNVLTGAFAFMLLPTVFLAFPLAYSVYRYRKARDPKMFLLMIGAPILWITWAIVCASPGVDVKIVPSGSSVEASSEPIRLGQRLEKNGPVIEASEFLDQSGNPRYVSALYRRGQYQVASLHEIVSGQAEASFVVIYSRTDEREMSAGEIQRILEHDGGDWIQNGELWNLRSGILPNGVPNITAVYKKPNHQLWLMITDKVGAFMAAAPSFREGSRPRVESPEQRGPTRK
jgi:hypothetical protein